MTTYPSVTTKTVAQKSNYPLWEFAAPPLMADVESFEQLKRYCIFTAGDITDDTIAFIKDMAVELESSKYKYRHNGKDDDTGSVTAVTSINPKTLETYRPFEKFGTVGKEASLTHVEPTYEAHAISASTWNLYAEKKKIPPKSNRKAISDAISANSEIDPSEKGELISSAIHKDKENKAQYSTFDGQQSFIRGFKASDTHVVLGQDCVTPVKFILISTTDGCENISEMKDGDKSSHLSYQLMQSELYKIPLFNIATSKGREKFKAYLAGQ